MKWIYPGVTKAMMYRIGGVQFLLSGRAHGQVFVSVTAYHPGRPNSNDGLRQDLSSALNDFSLTGTYLGALPNQFRPTGGMPTSKVIADFS